MNKWSPVTLTEIAEPNDAIEFVMTPQDRTNAAIVRLDIERMKLAEKAGFTPGLVVKEISLSELTAEERAAFGLEA